MSKLSRVDPATCLVTDGIGSSPTVTQNGISGTKWMDGRFLQLQRDFLNFNFTNEFIQYKLTFIYSHLAHGAPPLRWHISVFTPLQTKHMDKYLQQHQLHITVYCSCNPEKTKDWAKGGGWALIAWTHELKHYWLLLKMTSKMDVMRYTPWGNSANSVVMSPSVSYLANIWQQCVRIKKKRTHMHNFNRKKPLTELKPGQGAVCLSW